MFRGSWLLLFLAMAPLSPAPATAATTPSQVCEAAKLKAQANFTKCRLAADATNAKTPSPTKRDAAYTKCAINLATAYSKAEAKAATVGASCPTTGDRADIDDGLTGHFGFDKSSNSCGVRAVRGGP